MDRGSHFFSAICRHRHLMLDVVSLLPHCKKDNKVESKESKGAALNELVDLKNCKVGFDVLYKVK